MEQKNPYKYSTDKQLLDKISSQLTEHFKSVFDSYNFDRKTFIYQTLNVFFFTCLVFLISSFGLGIIFYSVLDTLNGWLVIGINVVLAIFLVVLGHIISSFFDLRVLYEFDLAYSKKILKRLLLACITTYLIKEYGFKSKK